MRSTATITGRGEPIRPTGAPVAVSGVIVSDSIPGQIETVMVNVLPATHGGPHAATGVQTVVGAAAGLLTPSPWQENKATAA